MEVSASVIMPKGEGSMVSQPSSSVKYKPLLTGIRMTAPMLVKLVSTHSYKGEHQQMNLLSRLSTATRTAIQGDWRLAVDCLTKADTGTGVKLESRNELTDSTTNCVASNAMPERATAKLRSEGEMLAKASAEKASGARAVTAVPKRMLAGLKPSAAASLGDEPFPVPSDLAARLITWVAPEMVDEKTLYITQVYETERDGNVLILH